MHCCTAKIYEWCYYCCCHYHYYHITFNFCLIDQFFSKILQDMLGQPKANFGNWCSKSFTGWMPFLLVIKTTITIEDDVTKTCHQKSILYYKRYINMKIIRKLILHITLDSSNNTCRWHHSETHHTQIKFFYACWKWFLLHSTWVSSML